MGPGSTALLGSGGSRAPTQHRDPWHGFRAAAATLTVRVSAPLAGGEQTC